MVSDGVKEYTQYETAPESQKGGVVLVTQVMSRLNVISKRVLFVCLPFTHDALCFYYTSCLWSALLSHLKQTTPGLTWKRTETPVFRQSRVLLLCPHRVQMCLHTCSKQTRLQDAGCVCSLGHHKTSQPCWTLL